jgi:hypothetical protein
VRPAAPRGAARARQPAVSRVIVPPASAHRARSRSPSAVALGQVQVVDPVGGHDLRAGRVLEDVEDRDVGLAPLGRCLRAERASRSDAVTARLGDGRHSPSSGAMWTSYTFEESRRYTPGNTAWSRPTRWYNQVLPSVPQKVLDRPESVRVQSVFNLDKSKPGQSWGRKATGPRLLRDADRLTPRRTQDRRAAER